MENPAKKFIEFKSSKKSFTYYDKEKGEEVSLGESISFVPLQILHTIKGVTTKQPISGIYSNEVYDLTKQELHVRVFGREDIKYDGLYTKSNELFKLQVASLGGKWSQSIYAMLPNGELVNLNLKGSGLGSDETSWFDISKAVGSDLRDGNITKGVTASVNPEPKVNGTNTFNEAQFKLIDVKPETLAKAKEVNEVIKNYLNEYMNKGLGNEIVKDAPKNIVNEDIDSLPF